MGPPETADGEQPPEFARGGLILGPDGEDSVRPWFEWFDPRWERIFTAAQVRRYMAAKPGSRDALS